MIMIFVDLFLLILNVVLSFPVPSENYHEQYTEVVYHGSLVMASFPASFDGLFTKSALISYATLGLAARRTHEYGCFECMIIATTTTTTAERIDGDVLSSRFTYVECNNLSVWRSYNGNNANDCFERRRRWQ